MSIHTSGFFMQNCRNFTEALSLSLSLSLASLQQSKQRTRRRRDLAGSESRIGKQEEILLSLQIESVDHVNLEHQLSIVCSN